MRKDADGRLKFHVYLKKKSRLEKETESSDDLSIFSNIRFSKLLETIYIKKKESLNVLYIFPKDEIVLRAKF